MNQEEREQWSKDHPEGIQAIIITLTPVLASLMEIFQPIFKILEDIIDKIIEMIEEKSKNENNS